MKTVLTIIVSLSILLAACAFKKEEPTVVSLNQHQRSCFDVALNQAKAIPGKDVYYKFAIECGSKEEARAFRTNTFNKEI